MHKYSVKVFYKWRSVKNSGKSSIFQSLFIAYIVLFISKAFDIVLAHIT